MEEKRGRSQMNKGLVFLLVFLVAVAALFVYAKLAFTGYVTNIGNATNGVLISSTNFDSGDFSNTYVNTNGQVELMPTKNSGTYVSQVFSAPQSMVWNSFVPTYSSHSSANYSEDPVNNTLLLYVRSCDDIICTGKDFSLFTGSLNLIGQYFQYKTEMQIASGNQSPTLSEVNLTYYPVLSLPIVITSPQSVTYNNGTLNISISANPEFNTSSVWFFITNDTNNETYTGEIFNRTFTEGQYTITAWVSYTDGSVTYENSTTTSFSVWYLHTYYRLSNNACGQVSIIASAKTANDYNNLTDCQSHITTNTTTQDSDNNQADCKPVWACENWSDCVDGQQTRICYDTSTCTIVSTEGKPAESQSCTGGTVTTQETTNPAATTQTETTQTETKKSFLSIVGSVITAPVKTVTGTVISIVILALIAGGFVAFRLSKKKSLGAFFNSIGRRMKGDKLAFR